MNIYELRLYIKEFLEELKMIEINKNLENFYRIDPIYYDYTIQENS